MNRTTLISLLSASVFAMPAAAASLDGYTLSHNKQKIYIDNGGAAANSFTYYANMPASATIYSNLAVKYKKGIYFSGEGATLCGTNCPLQSASWVAGGFTPSANATAMQVQAAVGTITGGTSITLAIYSDDKGVPGKALWSGVAKNLPAFGTCCTLAKAHIADGLALKGGTPYWLVAVTDKSQASFFGAWSPAEIDQVDPAPEAFDLNQGGWKASMVTQPPAFGIFSR